MHRTRKSFKETLNQAIRAGLRRPVAAGRRARFVVRARAMGLRPGFDPAGLNKLVDDLEAEAFLEKPAGGGDRS